MDVVLGLDRWLSDGFASIKGQRIGLVCNQASVSSSYVHVLDLMLPHHKRGDFAIGAVFGPQHGIWGHTQDNMIEWEGYEDPRTGLTFFSLYGEHREPTDEMLAGLDRVVIDVPDIGSRYYTFIWTTALTMKACERQGIPVTILDRPNPINGVDTEGPLLDPAYASFVGLHPLPARHGLTLGEAARQFKELYYPGVELEVVEVEGWDRSLYADECGAPWAMPSPNMPTVDTAVVYPGMCLIEGTQLSEARGTTKPFEMFGAPFVDGWKLTDELNSRNLPGVIFRPVQFLPTFQKCADEICQGSFLHVTDRRSFKPLLTGCTVIQAVINLWPEDFKWLEPPYEYEWNLMPIDILLGSGEIRKSIESGADLREALEPNVENFTN
jgi:uncharacterized protein YbbC (DUF1343 family)